MDLRVPRVRRGQPFQKEPAEESYDALMDMSRVPRASAIRLLCLLALLAALIAAPEAIAEA